MLLLAQVIRHTQQCGLMHAICCHCWHAVTACQAAPVVKGSTTHACMSSWRDAGKESKAAGALTSHHMRHALPLPVQTMHVHCWVLIAACTASVTTSAVPAWVNSHVWGWEGQTPQSRECPQRRCPPRHASQAWLAQWCQYLQTPCCLPPGLAKRGQKF